MCITSVLRIYPPPCDKSASEARAYAARSQVAFLVQKQKKLRNKPGGTEDTQGVRIIDQGYAFRCTFTEDIAF